MTSHRLTCVVGQALLPSSPREENLNVLQTPFTFPHRLATFASMHRIFATTLLFLHLLSAVVPAPVKDVFAQLPALAGHYQTHMLEDPKTGLFEFFSMHYGEAFAQHRSDHNHENLPGKNEHQHTGICACAIPALPVSVPFLTLVPELPEGGAGAELFQEQNLFPSSHLSSIWQPPRLEFKV
jgi:hypothetical protein